MAKTVIDTSKLPANLVITNNTDKEIMIPLYPDNGTFILAPDEEMVYQVSTAREYLYYYTTCKDLGLSLAEAEADGE